MKFNSVLAFSIGLLGFLGGCQSGSSVKNNDTPITKQKSETIYHVRSSHRGFSRSWPLYLKPVVRFSCARRSTPTENALETDLKGLDDEKKLIALGKLMKHSAPSSVPLQYKAFQSLKDKHSRHKAILLAKKMFDADYIRPVIFQKPPKDEYSSDHYKFFWCLRAVGVLQLKEFIPRLKVLSSATNLYTYLAAERSFEDFKGKEAEDALLYVVSRWKYNAYNRAGIELVKRNPKKLSKALEKMTPPESDKHNYALLLARCHNPKAVPILCETVKGIGIIDGTMFNYIASLGRPGDKEIIMSLPQKVRKEQQKKAKQCIETYLKRMKKE